jgi:DNA-directed RNA polymerase sigma subunit (sigma70/sigma32)
MWVLEGNVSNWTRDELLFVLAMVSSREREVLGLRYGLDGFPPCSWAEVAAAFGISTARAYGVERKALKRAYAALS